MRTRTTLLLALAALGASAALASCGGASTEPDLAPPPGSVWDSHHAHGAADAAAPDRDARVKAAAEQYEAKSRGCLSCHEGIEPDHGKANLKIGCVDCHGGDGQATTKEAAHPASNDPALAGKTVTPSNWDAEWMQLNWEYVRFVNPGDLRVADATCGGCHPNETYATKKSMMTHGAMLWAAALYNNGSFPLKRPHFGEAYDENGTPVRVQTVPAPTDEEITRKGVVAYLDPFPRYNVSQMGNILRVFERGTKRPLEIGNPDKEEESGLPARRLSERGLGTKLRTDPVYLGISKTRLLDPVLWMPGTNDHPGDYRHSGCTACHMVYANDRDPVHSGHWAQHGNRGLSKTGDRTIPKDEPGHPITHTMTRAIPSSQCVVCHMHPGTNMLTTYYGDMWYDDETDSAALYHGREDLTHEEAHEIQQRNPNAAALRGKWADPEFLAESSRLNPQLKNVQLADYHGHGWLFRKVWKKDRKGNLLDAAGKIVSPDDPQKWSKTVHLMDIHAERGMHCVDCHFTQDVHGTGKLHSEPRAATEIMCVDCHGTVSEPATLVTSGVAGGNDLADSKVPSGEKRFTWRRGTLYQRSQLDPNLVWAVPQVADAADPSLAGKEYFAGQDGGRQRPVFNEKAQWAHTVRKDGATWGGKPAESELAHGSDRVTCQTCHTAWTTSCYGCHLSMSANNRKEIRHWQGGISRNWTSYNYQSMRDDTFLLGRDGTVTGNKVSPIRPACPIVVGSQNQNREWIYSQQQTISAEGYSGQAFSPYVPHTVRKTETRACTECHLSETNDNNAWMAQVLMHGTNWSNFMGRICYVGCGDDGFYAVTVTERDEPQAVIGSTLHRDAFPQRHERFVASGRELTESWHHGGTDTRSIQLRGEYLYAAEGAGGMYVYDVANVDNKGFSERITTSLNSPLGQRFYIKSKMAAAVASPTTLGVDPTRPHRPENEEAEHGTHKQPIHPLYAFLYVADREEGLVMVLAATLLDGDPQNNFLERNVVFNPDGILKGAQSIHVAGEYAYVGCDAGLVILDLDFPLSNPVPKVVQVIPDLRGVTSICVQFRYAFVTDAKGMAVVDVTDPKQAAVVPGARIELAQANDVYVARTYAYVSAGKQGLVIVDVENPEKPKIDQVFDAGGAMNDVRMTRIAVTNASLFAYVADGVNGLRVVQLTSPEAVPQFAGFSPRPRPELISTFRTKGPALALSKPLDRDRGVDESGNQLAVFGRIGSRPFTLEEQQKLYIRDGKVFKVRDEPKRPASGDRSR
ncbi:MAG: hypothetical protein HMLKMBBP_03984 [Planctomycetes bacterium]|nr:hypothetical protein [Planctomycetota bacterium]